MKKHLPPLGYLMTAAALMLSSAPVMAANVDVGINVGIQGAYAPEPVQPRAVYVQQQAYGEPEDAYWKCKKDKCKLKKDKKKKHHKDD